MGPRYPLGRPINPARRGLRQLSDDSIGYYWHSNDDSTLYANYRQFGRENYVKFPESLDFAWYAHDVGALNWQLRERAADVSIVPKGTLDSIVSSLKGLGKG